MTRAALALLIAMIASAGEAWSPRPGITVQGDGRIMAGGLVLVPMHYDGDWKTTTSEKAVDGAGRRGGDGTWRLEGPWRLAAGAGKYLQTVAAAGADAVQVAVRLDEAGATNAFAVSLTLDGAQYRNGEIRIDGASVALPKESAKPQVRAAAPAKTVAVPLPSGGWLEIAGDLTVMVQDNQSWKTDSFSLRLLADKQMQIGFSLRLREPAIAALPLGAAAATPRRDKGGEGWTGQGDNDLRVLPSGRLVAAHMPFEVADGAAVLSKDRVPGRPGTATIPAKDRHGACLYLLNSLAWAPQGEGLVGTIRLAFADGSSESREVKSGRDVADWWNPPDRLANAALGWAGDNPQARVGLFVSRYPISDKPLDRIELEVAPGTVWMVVGMAIGEDAPLPPQVPDTITEGPRWRPIEVSWETQPGTALDLSWMNPGPVSGRIVPKGPDLVLEAKPDAPVRLLGANLCFTANYPEKPLAERMAKAMRSLGYNSVRIHHYDGALVKPGGDGTEMDPAKLDLLEYLVARCKAEGLWVTTDVYVSRRIPKGAIPEMPDRDFGQEFKALVPILPSAMDNWKKFATNFLGHKNPYTGLTWAEDPALVLLSMVNEDNLTSTVGRDPKVKALYDQRFEAWLATRPEAERSGKARDAARLRWLRDLQAAAYAVMRAHVRSLGVTAPTLTCNMSADWYTISARESFDMVDNHAYHDHPRFPVQQWRLPYGFNQRSPVAELLSVPAGLAQSRRLDQPFTVSELNYVFPNHHRAQYAAGVPAVAGLQGWSAIWRFAMAHDIKLFSEAGPASGFDLVRDPIALLSERAMALLWRRGDVAPAPWCAALAVDPAVAAGSSGGPTGLGMLALHARIGNLPAATAQGSGVANLKCLFESPAGGKAPAGALPVLPCDGELPAAMVKAGLIPAADLDPEARRVRSAGGQIAIDAKAGVLTVATARSVAAVLPGGGSATVGGIAIANPDPEEATVVVAALDGDLATGKRLLVLHLTDAANSGVRFADRHHTLVEAWGAAPVLVRAGSATVRLPGADKGTAWALDLSGARREQVALAADGAGARLDASVVRAWGPCLAWEIVRE